MTTKRRGAQDNMAALQCLDILWLTVRRLGLTQMAAEERVRLTWEDATQRFLDVSELKAGERPTPMERGFDRAAWMLHNSLNGAPHLHSQEQQEQSDV